MKSKIINYIIGILFLIYYFISIRNSYLQIVTYKNSWYLGEWIINYQDGGFKRRGLFGSIFIFLNEITHINLKYPVFSFVFLIYTLFFCLLIRLFLFFKNNLITIAILLLPSGFGMPLKDPSIAAKKDITALIIIPSSFLWNMVVLHQALVTFPALDSVIKRAYYFIFYKIQNIFQL